jgi:hypothetical protein
MGVCMMQTGRNHQSVLSGQEAYVIINIGNEPYGNNNTSSWVNDTIGAIQSKRNAGFDHTLVVDAPNWGQDWSFTMRDNAQSIYDADPDGNTILSIHMYGVFDTAAEIQDYIDTIRGQGLPLLVGEFGHNHSDGNPDEDTIMSYTQQTGVGWIAWSWSGNSDDVSYLDMVNDFDVDSKTDWGNRVISGSNGLSSTSELCSLFDGATIPPVTATPSPVPTPDGNLAMNQPVQASASESSDLGPEKAVDGDQETRWASSTDTNNWIYVDLGSTVDIERVIIMWEAAYSVGYRLEVSDDTSNWTAIFTETNGDGKTDDITLSGTGGATPGPTTPGTPEPTAPPGDPTPVPGEPMDCSDIPVWSANDTYENEGMTVQYNGNVYRNNWYSHDQNPEENSGEYQVWTLIGSCAGDITPSPTDISKPEPTQPPSITPDPSGLLGDADVDIIDALLVAQYCVELDVDINVDVSDVDCDGDIDIIDALLIAQYYVELITGFC